MESENEKYKAVELYMAEKTNQEKFTGIIRFTMSGFL